LDSILAQTYSDFEVIVVNDGSKDSSVALVEQYCDPRIKIHSQENKGLFHARLEGLKVAKNEVCLYVDADDKIEPNLLSVLVEAFEGGADCVVYGIQPFYKDEDYLGKIKEKGVEEKKGKEALRMLLSGQAIQSIVCKAFYKKFVAIEKLEKYPRIAVGEDALHTLEIYSKVNKTVFIKEQLSIPLCFL
jgi:glycosyltransferase involved in cell wall biosynthesis